MNDSTTATPPQISTGIGTPWGASLVGIWYAFIVATKPTTITAGTAATSASSHNGGLGTPYEALARRRSQVLTPMITTSASASHQLASTPMAPSKPPPSRWKNASLTGCVLPSATRKAAPRNDINPP